MTTRERPAPSLPPQYAPAEVEAGRYDEWVERGYFTPDPTSGRPTWSLVIPPPNVTGSLHVGHAFEHSLIDALVRRARMQGYETLWLPGMDHASIAVHALVEKELAAEGLDRRDLGRDAFVERVWEWKAQYGGQILAQMRRLGDSVDWSRERFTMDDGLSTAVQTMFKRLYDDGLIYRAERLVNWSPVLQSVLSDAEVDHVETEGELVSMRYGPMGEGGITVATTRVETMLGDTAVAVHPDDERYAALVGTSVELPLTGRMIPVIADAHVDPAFGTGAVKVTPAHDPNDYEIGRRHGLAMPTIMDERGRIANTGTRFDGLDRFEARVAVREALREVGRIVAEKRPYLHAVGHSERSKEPIEPRLSLQWYVKIAPLAQAAADAARRGELAFSPPEAADRYYAWVENLHDWCISRQLWWGHRIPVWYSPDRSEVVCLGPGDAPPAGWLQDEDVLDTWFSAGLWPFATLGWPEQTPDLAAFYPTTVLVTGYDILFFWVVRMMMFGLYATGEVPFETVAFHGMIRDEFGKKMSKSRGNGVDPLVWMDAYGSDAVRFTMARIANPGTDAPISDTVVESSRNFCTKLWNATRFALLNGANVDGDLPTGLTGPDAWIVSRLNEVVAQVDQLWEAFEFAKIADVLYHFAWDEVCDWYLELAKIGVAAGNGHVGRVLGEVLDGLLRLLHPMMPFITETLWTTLTGGESLVVARWPMWHPARIDPSATAAVGAVQALVTEVRRFRADQGVKPSRRLPARITGPAAAVGDEALVRGMLLLDAPGDDFAATASFTTAAGVTVALDTSGALDVVAERARLGRELTVAQKDLDATARKLGNAQFLAKAPADVVAGIQARHTTAQADIDRVQAALAALPDVADAHLAGVADVGAVSPLGRGRVMVQVNGHDRSTRAAEAAAAVARVDQALATRWGEGRIAPSLVRIRALLDLLGDPQTAYRSVHITGTNGKTSTARMIDELLRAASLRTGRYTSPHLTSLTERIVIDGEPVDGLRLAETYDEIAPLLEIVDAQNETRLTFFEVLTALGYAIFADVPVEVAVVEVGLGGSWDATNVLDGDVAVVLPIGLEHQEYLGYDVATIAAEKAGIIKPDATAIFAIQDPAAAEVLVRRAAEVGATIAREGMEFGIADRRVAVGGQMISLQGLGGRYEEIFLPLYGAHQAQNAVVALAAVEAFFGAGASTGPLDVEMVRAAFAAVTSPGRLEAVRSSPTVLLDAAHNPHGMTATVAAVRESFDFRRLVAVVGVLEGKDVSGMLTALQPIVDEVVITQNSSPRAMSADDLAAVAIEVFDTDQVTVEPRLDDALETAIRLAEESDVDTISGSGVLVTGSVITVGEARTLLGGSRL